MSVLDGLGARDTFGVAKNLLGPHDETFFGAVGRFVLLTSLLENRLRVLHDRFGCQLCSTPNSLHSIIAACGQHVNEMPSLQDSAALTRVLADADAARQVRNQLAHYLFPAQSDGTVFGWSERGGKVRTTDDPMGGGAPNKREPVSEWVERVRALSMTVEQLDSLTWRLPARPIGATE